MTKKVWLWFGGIIGTVLAVSLLLWVWVLLFSQPLTHPLATRFAWPVACTARGCVTTTAWHNQQSIMTTYAQSFGQSAPRPEVTLTTLIRQKLIQDATVKSSVTLGDASQYRQEILHLTDESVIQQRTGISGAVYDEMVVLPFLEQEALRQQRKAESITDMYQQLAAERWVVIPLRAFRWDKATGQVLAK